jgi:hypothetical protein
VVAFISPTLSLVYYVCQELVPISERWSFNFLPKSLSQTSSSDCASVLKDRNIWAIQILPDHDEDTIFTKALLQRLLPVSGLEHLDWEVYVVLDPGKPVNSSDIFQETELPQGLSTPVWPWEEKS